MHWQMIDTGAASAAANMDWDLGLLESCSQASSTAPMLHLYDWLSPSITYGYFIQPHAFLNMKGIEKQRIDLARRPTGGGITLHMTDFAFSMIVPAAHPAYSLNTLHNYAFINAITVQLLSRFTGQGNGYSLLAAASPMHSLPAQKHCMAHPTIYDVMFEGRKLGGAAQRRTRHGFLHQGTISLAFPEESLLEQLLLSGREVVQAMQENAFCLLGNSSSQNEIAKARQALKHHLKALLIV